MRAGQLRCSLSADSAPRHPEVAVHRIPAWILLIVAALAVTLVVVGEHELEEIGPLPMTLGILWGLFVLASAPKVFSQKDHKH